MDNTQNCDDLTWSEWGCGYNLPTYMESGQIEDLCQTILYMMKLFGKLIKEFTKENLQ